MHRDVHYLGMVELRVEESPYEQALFNIRGQDYFKHITGELINIDTGLPLEQEPTWELLDKLEFHDY